LHRARKRGLRADAFGEHHSVVDSLEMDARVSQKGRCTFWLRGADVRLREEVTDPPETERRRSTLQQRGAERDRIVVPPIGDEDLQLEQARLRVVGRARRFGEEELDRLAGPARDVLEGGERRARASSLDQVDRRRSHVSLAELREAETGLDARLLHRAWTKVDPWKTATLRRCARRN
jgi:hypothetical protein